VIGLAALAALCAGAARACGKYAAGVLFGAGLFALLSWVSLLATGQLATWWLDASGIALGLALWLTARRRPARGDAAKASGLPRAALLVAALLAAASFAFALWARPDGGWDAVLIWSLRARLLTAAAPLPVAFDKGLLHTDYPLLVPLLAARLGSPALVALIFAALTPLALWSFARDAAGKDAAALAAALLLATPLFSSIAAEQYADVPLAAFVLLAAGFAARDQALWAGLAAGLAFCTKNDGALALGSLALVFVLLRPRRLWRFALGTLPAFAVLACFKLSRWPQANDLISALSPSSLLARLHDWSRIRDIGASFFKAPLRPLEWGAGPLFLLGALFVRPLRDRLLMLFLAVSGAAIFLVYLTTPRPLAWHLETSFDRLLLQVWPTALLLCARQIGHQDGAILTRTDASVIRTAVR
jgi:hypothetical protein